MFLRRRPIFRQVTSATLASPSAFVADERREARFALWTARLCWLFVMLTAAVWAWHPLGGGDDVWAHAAIGRWIVQHHSVPQHTLFQWAHPPIPWIAHSWATQLTFYFLLQYGGTVAVVLFSIAFSLLPFMLLWRDWSRRVQGQIGLIAPLLFTVGVYVSTPRFRPRPELFTAFAFTLLLIYLSHWPRRRTLSWLWLPPLFCIWANFHGAVALGLTILGLTVVGDMAQETFRHYQSTRDITSPPNENEEALVPARWPLLLLVFALCCAAVFVNPYGLKYSVALKPVAGVMFSKIDEWKPYWQTPFLPRTYVIGEMLLWGVTLSGWIANPRRRWTHLLWILFMGVAFLMARRQLWLLALTCLCVSADAAANLRGTDWRTLLQNIFTRRKPREGPIYVTIGQRPALIQRMRRVPYLKLPFQVTPHFWRRLGQGVVITGLATWWLRSTPPLSQWRAKGAKEANLPSGSVTLLRRLQPHRLFNDYEYSSYLQWRFGGHPPLYIDLLNAYPDFILTDYLTMLRPAGDGHALWERNHPDAVYVRPHDANSALEDVNKWLKSNRNWKKVYDQKDGAVWLRQSFATEIAPLLPPTLPAALKNGEHLTQPLPALKQQSVTPPAKF